MASYDNLLTEQPWSFRPTSFPDTWLSDLFTMETETLAEALQTSISGGGAASSHGSASSSGMLQSVYSKAAPHTPTVSGAAESENLAPRKRRGSVPPIGGGGGGRVAKRKSRPSKRAALTTFIAADPENFMEMVQQVTGVRLGGGERLASAAVLRPEPRRAAAADGFPTLDTSAFMVGGSTSSSSLVSPPYAAAAGGGGAGASEHYLDSLCSFPTLESWEAVV